MWHPARCHVATRVRGEGQDLEEMERCPSLVRPCWARPEPEDLRREPRTTERERERDQASSIFICVVMTYILAYHESNPRPHGLCAKPLTIVITYKTCDYNNCIFSEYKIFGIF